MVVLVGWFYKDTFLRIDYERGKYGRKEHRWL